MSHEQINTPEYKKLYRGIWANKLIDQEELPVGGSIFSTELTTKLKLDFSSFEQDLESVTPEKIAEHYEKNKDSIKKWLEEIKSDIDPFTFLIAMVVQKKVDTLLDVKPDASLDERSKLYSNGATPLLSELRGKSACGERAALGQYLLQKLGVESSYMSGISIQNPENTESYPEDHSFIVFHHEGTDVIFDIARPKSQENLPRLLRSSIPFNAQVFDGKNDALIETREVLQGQKIYFGVGDPTSGHRNILKKENE